MKEKETSNVRYVKKPSQIQAHAIAMCLQFMKGGKPRPTNVIYVKKPSLVKVNSKNTSHCTKMEKELKFRKVSKYQVSNH